MNEDEVKKRLEKLKKLSQLEMQKKIIAKRLLTAEAYERLMNVRSVNPELYNKVIGTLSYLMQVGRVNGKLNEEQLKEILGKMTERRETKIEIKRKGSFDDVMG